MEGSAADAAGLIHFKVSRIEERMERLWSPWRSKYIESFANEKKTPMESCDCLFCMMVNAPEKDAENYVVFRGTTCFVVLNLYPYNSGHIMIVPHSHTGDFTALTPAESTEMIQLAQRSIRAITEALHPHGFNMGVNIGRVSGAGIDAHVHMHVVPRWNGDTNFMPVLGETRVISQAIEETYRKLKEQMSK